ncbi:MAG: hypothetical protein BECKG1743D_GA0114223_109622 [Candidatus Kentron sp. G]|nr:MAG: hypothetical protein BECKG1743F_GA0114225_111653 [Candidatus Kentron sp. G]VFN07017.1 MAG: hypothetical protein BECKG1743D_GA0114223_109622 [Candidatus Kentron sp. G]
MCMYMFFVHVMHSFAARENELLPLSDREQKRLAFSG